jgi:hypothetical protein
MRSAVAELRKKMTRYGLHLVHGGLPLGQHGKSTMTITRRGKTGPVPAAVFGDTGSWKTASGARWRPASEVEPAIFGRLPSQRVIAPHAGSYFSSSIELI